MSTYMPKASDIERKWYIIDAEGQSCLISQGRYILNEVYLRRQFE